MIWNFRQPNLIPHLNVLTRRKVSTISREIVYLFIIESQGNFNKPLTHCALRLGSQVLINFDFNDVEFQAAKLDTTCKDVGGGQATILPPLLIELASITPLRLILQGLRGHQNYRDLKKDQTPLYDFHSEDQ